MKIWIGCDHAGYAYKKVLIEHLTQTGYESGDCGCDGERADYPVIAQKTARCVLDCPGSLGILICGTGIGMSIAANKINGIRAAVCTETYSAKYTRLHNDANILCMGARVIGQGLMMDIADTFLGTAFEGGRHAQRVAMIAKIEQEQRTARG